MQSISILLSANFITDCAKYPEWHTHVLDHKEYLLAGASPLVLDAKQFNDYRYDPIKCLQKAAIEPIFIDMVLRVNEVSPSKGFETFQRTLKIPSTAKLQFVLDRFNPKSQ